MVRTISYWLNNHIYCRYLFYGLLISSVVVNLFIFQHNNFYILYILLCIFLGLGFYDKPSWFLAFVTTIIVLFRFFLLPGMGLSMGTFFIHLFTYQMITFITVGLKKNNQRVREDNLELVKALSNALDSRDSYTQNHSEAVAEIAVQIAKAMKLPKAQCNDIHIGGLLHDIGKIGVPEQILTKPSRLTNEEYSSIKTHPTIGFDMVKHISSFKNNDVLDIILYHHERYDGNGYPSGLKGSQIPLAARIVAVADTFDAITSKRVYREELDLDYALNEIKSNKGTQFDPDIVDVFLRLYEREDIKDIYKTLNNRTLIEEPVLE
ncbi:HD-GYP domain-containing protein [Neobacillus vireti]|uniref:HD-GYP domain-containing protein n=1 Tax=Neobacillus vireti TaxID=220686 RepID=UPI002FFD9ACB